MDIYSLPPVVSAITGAFTGAVAGGLAGWWIGPTKAEREERGKRRIEARRAVGNSIRTFDSAIREHRQALFRREEPDFNQLETVAVALASETRVSSDVLPRTERRRLVRLVKKILGPGYWREGELRPYGRSDRKESDSIVLESIRQVRPATTDSAMNTYLRNAVPTDHSWDNLLESVAGLRRRYGSDRGR